jgi:ribosome-associated protein
MIDVECQPVFLERLHIDIIMTFRQFLALNEAMNADLTIGEITIPKEEIAFSFARSSGPGGSNVNKVSSKCCLKWDVMGSRAWLGRWELRNRFVELWKNRINKEGILVISSQAERDQLRNIYHCVGKLRELVGRALMRTK